MYKQLFFLALSLLLSIPSLHAQEAQDGPVIKGFGAVYTIDQADYPADPDRVYRVVFDVASGPTDAAELNKAMNTLARFLNMHAQSGVPTKNLQVVAVMHGGSARHSLTDAAYRQRYGVDNPHTALIRQLTEAGVDLYLCGQSMHARGFKRDEVNEHIDLSLSAMTILIDKQAEGYSMIRL